MFSISPPQIPKPIITYLDPYEEEITQNPEVSIVYKFGWPDWKGKKTGGKRVVVSLY